MQPLNLQVEVLVPTGSDEAAVRNALQEQYRQTLAAQYPGAIINPNIPITTIENAQVGQEGDQVRYRATMQAFVQLPQEP
jgi:hypothetical protein